MRWKLPGKKGKSRKKRREKEGKKEGEREGKYIIAAAMKADGETTEKIIRYTDLTREQIEKL